MNLALSLPLLVPLEICPKAPPGAQQYADQITGYVLWGVIILFMVGVVIGIGAIVAGRIFNMPHSSKMGIVSIFVFFGIVSISIQQKKPACGWSPSQ